MEVIEHHRALPRMDPGHQPDEVERLLSRPGVVWSVLFASLALTVLAWTLSLQHARNEATARFEQASDELHAKLATRMEAYEAVLRGGASLFAANSGMVTGEAWARYVNSLGLNEHYPGVQGLGVSQFLGGGDDAVRPESRKKPESAIIYLEPMNVRNQRAMGFDMLSEPRRRAALLQARDTGLPATSAIVILKQEDGRRVQNGFIVYLPVYKGGTSPQSEAERRANLWGWVYAPFRVGDLMAGVMGQTAGSLSFSLYDGDEANNERQFYDSRSADLVFTAQPMQRDRLLRVSGRHWLVRYRSADLVGMPLLLPPTLVAVGGLALELLLFGMLMLQTRRKRLTEGEVRERSAEVSARTMWLDAVSGLSPDGVLVFERDEDGQHRLVFTNPAFSELFNLRPADLLGLSESAVDEWLSGLAANSGDMPPLGDADASLQLAGTSPRVLQRSARADGRQRVYYFRDVTRESEVDRLKNEFLTTAAHELRTPLASVYGFSELLTRPDMPEAKRNRLIEIVYRQAGVLKHLVDQLLDLARIDARGDQDFHRARCDLRDVVGTAIESVRTPDAQHPLAAELGQDPLWVMVDATKVRQALVNALSNAQKYSPAGSPIQIQARQAPHEGASWAVVSVTDRGMGMTPEQTARAFERFYRADPSGHVLGAGFGLAIIQEMMARHGGRVELQSEAGVGTQINLWLPLLPTSEVAPEQQPAVQAELTS